MADNTKSADNTESKGIIRDMHEVVDTMVKESVSNISRSLRQAIGVEPSNEGDNDNNQ